MVVRLAYLRPRTSSYPNERALRGRVGHSAGFLEFGLLSLRRCEPVTGARLPSGGHPRGRCDFLNTELEYIGAVREDLDAAVTIPVVELRRVERLQEFCVEP